MGVFPSKINDKVLAEKLQRQQDALLQEGDVGEIRRSNSLVLALEDYIEGRADNLDPVEDPPVRRSHNMTRA
jgi:hypothetical protein